MLRLVVSLFAVASALHIDHQQHQKAATTVTIHDKKQVIASRKHTPLRHTINLANTYATLISKRQEPAAAEGGEEPPAGDLPIDEEGYKADWGTEHRSESYPPESIGKQHNPSYDQTAAKISAEIHGHWWWWVLLVVLVFSIIAFAYYKKSQ